MDSEKRERGAPFSVQSGFPGLLEEALELHKPSSDRMFSKLFATDTELEHRQRKTSPFSSMLGWKMVFPIAVSQNFLINGVCRRCSVPSLSRHGGEGSVIPTRWMDFFPAFVKTMLLCHSKWMAFLLFVNGELYLPGDGPSTPLVLMGCWRHRCCSLSFIYQWEQHSGRGARAFIEHWSVSLKEGILASLICQLEMS